MGKSGGFRLIAMIDRKEQEIVLLEIYPKVGPFAKDNVTDKELKIIIGKFIQEREAEKLVELNANKNLEVVPPKPSE